MLKIYETGKKGMSIGMKRFSIGTSPKKHLENILTLLLLYQKTLYVLGSVNGTLSCVLCVE